MVTALVSMMDSITSFPASFRTAIEIASLWTSRPIVCGHPDYVEWRFRSPVFRTFSELALDIASASATREQSTALGGLHGRYLKDPHILRPKRKARLSQRIEEFAQQLAEQSYSTMRARARFQLVAKFSQLP
jgi:hypothetical protein